jgi:hypothetical protein
MATTTNYGWTTPDDTALVKDGAAAIRTLGSSVDTTTKALNPSTTLGDIEYRSSTANTNTRLGIGSTGQVLTVAGGVPSWATAGGSLNYTLANAGGTTLSGAATITVSGLSNANFIQVFVDSARTNSAANPNCTLRINTDSGSNYSYIGLKFNMGTSAITAQRTSSGDSIPLYTWGANSSSNGWAVVSIQGGASSGRKTYSSNGVSGDGWGGEFSTALQGAYNSSSTISSISLITDAGNFSQGTIYIYTSA